MQFVSTRNALSTTTFKEALFRGLAPDGGLYIPQYIPILAKDFISKINQTNLLELGQEIIHPYIPEIPLSELQLILHKSLTFPIPLKQIEDNLYLLEVFHGPTLAFKDVGARFMANVLSYYLKQENKKMNILVATSGDTGSAIAHGFHNIENIDVYVLYPSKKISHLQEMQMTTLGNNIHALEVKGTFDDCQYLVKTALLDETLQKSKNLTTANSINICRLLPQIIYHSWGVVQFQKIYPKIKPHLTVPSGNFGNLVAAIYAKQMGLQIHSFIAATNANDTVPNYLHTGEFHPQSSRQTYSNAMDVGNPSNFERLVSLYHHDLTKIRSEIQGISISNEETIKAIQSTYNDTGYIVDPHTAVGLAAARKGLLEEQPSIITATAHPSKFQGVIKQALNIDIPLPESLQQALLLPKQAEMISTHYSDFKDILNRS